MGPADQSARFRRTGARAAVFHILAPMLPRLLVLAMLLVLAAAAPAEARRQVPFGWLGVNADGPLTGDAPAGEWDRLAGSGAESVRLAVRWNAAQPARAGALDLAGTDAAVLAAASRGLTVLPVIQDTPGWAASDRADGAASPPRDPATYAAFVRALAARYGPKGSLWAEHPEVRPIPIRAWQVWNEPNLSRYWARQPFARSYVRLVRATRAAVRGVDRGARIVLAGLPNRSWQALATIYRAGGRGTFDVVALHPYTGKPRDVVRLVEYARRVARRHHDGGVPIWLTELSWPAARGRVSGTPGFETTDRGQATRLREAVRLLAAARRRLGIGAVYWYTWLSAEGASSAFTYSGLRRIRDGATISAPSLTAYRAAARTLQGCAKAPGNARSC
jgi:hypothetical protein